MSKLDLSIIKKNVPSNLVDIEIFDEIDSTNEECKRSLSSKMLSVKIANKQTKGRGRRGKNWSSPSLGNIYMSIAQKNVETDFPLSLSAGVISYDAISSITENEKLGLKGPNDIIFDNKKNKFLAIGLYDPFSPIRVKVLQANKSANINEAWFENKIQYHEQYSNMQSRNGKNMHGSGILIIICEFF